MLSLGLNALNSIKICVSCLSILFHFFYYRAFSISPAAQALITRSYGTFRNENVNAVLQKKKGRGGESDCSLCSPSSASLLRGNEAVNGSRSTGRRADAMCSCGLLRVKQKHISVCPSGSGLRAWCLHCRGLTVLLETLIFLSSDSREEKRKMSFDLKKGSYFFFFF